MSEKLWVPNPKDGRKGETIGGGFWIFRRGRRTNRVRPSKWPFEYGTKEAAEEQVKALATAHPEERFVVVAQVDLWQAGERLSP